MSKVIVIAVLIAGALLFIQSSSRLNKPPEAVTPAADFAVPATELGLAENRALNGDCNSAYRLAQHYSFAILDEEKAIRWYRIAAKCGHMPAKAELTVILIHLQNREGIQAEIDALIAEIRKRDPEEAQSLAEYSEYLRKR